jgi:hypothetical protein
MMVLLLIASNDYDNRGEGEIRENFLFVIKWEFSKKWGGDVPGLDKGIQRQIV